VARSFEYFGRATPKFDSKRVNSRGEKIWLIQVDVGFELTVDSGLFVSPDSGEGTYKLPQLVLLAVHP
jgi:hypothetical protein